MNTKAPTRVSESDTIEKLKADIEQLQVSQKMMRDANAMLRKGDGAALRAMGFSLEHIAELKKRGGFKDYALRNNKSSIRRLKKLLDELTTRKINADKR